MAAVSTSTRSHATSALWLLVKVNLLQAWRRLSGLSEQSRLLTGFIALFLAGYLALAFWLFFKGLQFISNFPGLGSLLMERLLFLLFAFLFVLLFLSNLVISYTNLFRNRETVGLSTLPLSSSTIFRWKLIESTALASWAFLFLIAPFLAAYGLNRHVHWHFYAVTVGLVALFIVLPSVLGAWAAVALARFIDRRVFQILTVVGALVLTGFIAAWLQPEVLPDEQLETRVLSLLDKMLAKTRIAQFPFLPSYWLSASVMHWTEGAVGSAIFFMLVLLSNVLFFGLLAFTVTGRAFYEAASAVRSRGSVFTRWHWFKRFSKRRAEVRFPISLAERLFALVPGLARDTRALMLKDARMFWRDTTQWGQTLLLFGLLGVYIVNLRHFAQQLNHPYWVNLVSFLNLGACSLNLATLTTRFVYPQFSLEGKRLWIIGMAPLGLVRTVRIKFVMAAAVALIVTLSLIGLSCHMLDLSAARTIYFTGAIAVMTFTLTGLAVGLGALYPNFKEENPTRIVSGFGGTFCLILSFLYILGSIVLLAFGAPWNLSEVSRARALLFPGLFLLLSGLIGWLPLQLGLQRVRQFEL